MKAKGHYLAAIFTVLALTGCASIKEPAISDFSPISYPEIVTLLERETKEMGYSRIWYLGTENDSSFLVATLMPRPIMLMPHSLQQLNFLVSDGSFTPQEEKSFEYHRESWVLHDQIFGTHYRNRSETQQDGFANSDSAPVVPPSAPSE